MGFSVRQSLKYMFELFLGVILFISISPWLCRSGVFDRYHGRVRVRFGFGFFRICTIVPRSSNRTSSIIARMR